MGIAMKCSSLIEKIHKVLVLLSEMYLCDVGFLTVKEKCKTTEFRKIITVITYHIKCKLSNFLSPCHVAHVCSIYKALNVSTIQQLDE
jgi:hypothetical protein